MSRRSDSAPPGPLNIEAFASDLEARGRSRATIARRLCTVTCFYRYAEQEGLIEHSPAVHVRRPRLEQLGMERGHRTLTVLRKGGETVTMPMSPRTARAVDLAVGERFEGPILLGNDGERLDRHAAARIVRRIGKAAGINKKIGPHTLRHGFITAATPEPDASPQPTHPASLRPPSPPWRRAARTPKPTSQPEARPPATSTPAAPRPRTQSARTRQPSRTRPDRLPGGAHTGHDERVATVAFRRI